MKRNNEQRNKLREQVKEELTNENVLFMKNCWGGAKIKLEIKNKLIKSGKDNLWIRMKEGIRRKKLTYENKTKTNEWKELLNG